MSPTLGEPPPFRLYANLIPESLVASNLEPAEYGAYLATGQKGHSRGQAIFFEVDAARVSESFPMQEARERCHPSAAGTPKHSVYLGIYRVLERLPLNAFGALHLVTDDGRCLALESGPMPPPRDGLHYYEELAPVKTRVLSRLGPEAFVRHLTKPGAPVTVPRVAFAELSLPQGSEDDEGDVPYGEVVHLRECMQRMEKEPTKITKMVTRMFHGEVVFRTIIHGFFVGDAEGVIHYPMPSHEELKLNHYDWWRSAQTLHMG